MRTQRDCAARENRQYAGFRGVTVSFLCRKPREERRRLRSRDKKRTKNKHNSLKQSTKNGKCVIIVTHSSYVAECADEKIELKTLNHS